MFRWNEMIFQFEVLFNINLSQSSGEKGKKLELFEKIFSRASK